MSTQSEHRILTNVERYPLLLPLKDRARAVKRGLRFIQQSLDRGLSTASPRSSGFYYFLVNKAFDREHFSVAAGKARFAKDLTLPGKTSFRLRRNIHRLEKGLIMPNRRDVFALDYIIQTTDDFARVTHSYAAGEMAQAEIIWAHDVLAEYFSVVDLKQPRIADCHRVFLGALDRFNALPRPSEKRSTPFVRDLSVPTPDIDQMTTLSIRRRSVRSFSDEAVSRDLVDKAVAVAAQSPSACNRQPFRFRLYDDRDLVKKIVALPAGTKGFSNGVPCVAVVVGRLRAYPLERDRHIIYIDGSLAAMSFMFALETMGIASCAINWADEEPAESNMKKLLNLEDDERVVMLIGYGWPDPTAPVPYSAKRDLSELREYNRL
jgi:nitroreductase